MMYAGMGLHGFNDSVTHPCDTKELSIFIGEGINKRTMNMCFMVIFCKSVYNYISERCFIASLDAIASIVHLIVK